MVDTVVSLDQKRSRRAESAGDAGYAVPYTSGMRRLAAGVSIVATEHEGERRGLLSTAVISVSIEPPILLVSVNRSASTHDALHASGRFCVNVLHEEDQEIAARFGSPHLRHLRFQDREWKTLVTGAPALLGALVSFDCEIVREIAIETHTLFLGRVLEARSFRSEVEPLLYVDGDYRVLHGSAADPRNRVAP